MAWEEVQTTQSASTGNWEEEEPSKLDLLKQGFVESATGLIAKRAMGTPYTKPTIKSDGFTDKLVESVGTLAGDLPAFIGLGLPGILAGPVAPVAIPALGMGATETLKSGLRGEMPTEAYKAGGKGALIGGSMGALSSIAKLASPLAKTALPLEVAGPTVIQSGLEGKDTTPEDLALMAVPIAGLKGAGRVISSAKKAIETPNLQRVSEHWTEVAEEAGIPQVAPKAGTPSVLSSVTDSAIKGASIAQAKRNQATAIQERIAKQRENVEKEVESISAERATPKDRVIIEESPETSAEVDVRPLVDRLDNGQKQTVESKINELGSIEKIDALYKTDSAVDQYARQRAREVIKTVEVLKEEPPAIDWQKQADEHGVTFNGMQERFNKPDIPLFTNKEGTTFTLGEGETLTDAIKRKQVQQEAANPPSVQKLNKGDGLSPEEWLQLEKAEFNSQDGGVRVRLFSQEELDALKKEKPEKQREQFDRTFADTFIPSVDPEALAKARKVHEIAMKYDSERRAKVENHETLRREGWTEEQIDAISPEEVQRIAREIRGEDANGMSLPKVAKLDAVEQQTRDLADRLRSGEEVPEADIDAVVKLIVEEDNGEFLDILNRPSIFDKVDPDTGISLVSYSEYTRRMRENRAAIDKILWRRKQAVPPKVKNEAQKRRLKALGEDQAKWDEFLEKEEGMPAELNYEASENPSIIKRLLMRTDEWIAATEAKAEANRRFVEGVLSTKDLTKSNLTARNTVVAAYGYRPKDLADFNTWYKKVEEVETLAADMLEHRRPAFSYKALNDARRQGKISENEYKFAVQVFRSLKQQPTFELAFSEKGGYAGTYEFARNILTFKKPSAIAHEVMHYGFYNVLTGPERLAFLRDYGQQFYGSGSLDKARLYDITSEPHNAIKNPSEMFASRGADYIGDIAFTPVERSLFDKVRGWWNKVRKGWTKDAGKFEEVSKYFDKVIDKEGRRVWSESSNKPIVYEHIAGLANASRLRNSFTESKGTTLDMMGFQTLYEYIAERARLYKTANTETTGKKVLAEIDRDWGSPIPKTDKVISNVEGGGAALKRYYKNYFSSPDIAAAGTRNEGHVYYARKQSQFLNHVYHEHKITLDEIQKGIKDNVDQELTTKLLRERQNNLGIVDESKYPANVVEAANNIKGWLEVMKAKYKLTLLEEYKENLNKRENAALKSIIAGATPEELALKFPKINTNVLAEIARKYNEIDNWGIDDYITNMEQGRYKVLATGITSDGKQYKKLVAIGLSEKDAARKAVQYANEHPDSGDLFIDTDFRAMDDNITGISGKQYGAMIGDLRKKLMESVADIDRQAATELATATVRRKFKILPSDTYSPFIEQRRDIMKGEDNVIPLLYSYAYSMEKKMTLDPVIERIRADLRNMNKQEQEFILDYLEDIKGKYGMMDKFVDSVLGSYRGYSKAIGKARTYEANAKLGYRPIAAAINFASGQGHTLVKTGIRMYAEGLSFLKTAEGKKLMEEVAPYLGTSIAEIGAKIESATPIWHPLGMFQKPEVINREACIAANYLAARKRGLSHIGAREEAIRANWVQQFTYDVASLPKVFRGPTARAILQFKPYLLKEMEYISTLKGKEWLRYAAMQSILGGPKGIMLTLKTIPFLAAMGWWNEVTDYAEEWMNKNAPNLSRGIGGLPGLIDPDYAFDMSAAASFQFPTDEVDVMGVLASTATNLYKAFLKPPMEYSEMPKKQDLKVLLQESPAASRMWQAINTFMSSDGVVRDQQGKNIYKVEDTVPYMVQAAIGVDPAPLSSVKVEERILKRRERFDTEIKTRIANEAIDDVISGKEWSKELVDRLVKYGAIHTVIGRLGDRDLPPHIRAMLRSEVRKRAEVLENYPIPTIP